MNLKHYPHLTVGLAGASGSGKTTLAKMVNRLWAREQPEFSLFYLGKFAGPINAALSSLGIYKSHALYRDLAQAIGERCRAHDPAFFVRLQESDLRQCCSSSQVVFLYDDVRYVNEAEFCDLVIVLESSRPTALAAHQTLHESEREWVRIKGDLYIDTTNPDRAKDHAEAIYERIIYAAKAGTNPAP